MKSRLVISVVAICVVAFAAAGAGEGGVAPPPAYVAVGKVGETPNVEIRRYTGKVASSSLVNLVARVSGELLDIGFKEGDIVRKGQLLYRLDPIRYEAEVKNVEARIAEYKARLTYAELSFKRASELFERKAGTKDSMDSSESEYQAAKAALLAAEAQLVTTKDDLANTRIVAPISGKIGVTNYTEGNYLTPSSGVIATIIQVDPLRVAFSMSNREYLSLFGSEAALKDLADIRLRLADDSVYEHSGKVEFIDNHANRNTDTIQIFANFDNPDGKLVPDSTVTVLLSRRSGGSMASVVPSAVMHDDKSAYVYVVDAGNRVERRDVVLGGGDSRVQFVKSGLNPGESIIVDGMHKTMPGAVIEPDYKGGDQLTMRK